MAEEAVEKCKRCKTSALACDCDCFGLRAVAVSFGQWPDGIDPVWLSLDMSDWTWFAIRVYAGNFSELSCRVARSCVPLARSASEFAI